MHGFQGEEQRWEDFAWKKGSTASRDFFFFLFFINLPWCLRQKLQPFFISCFIIFALFFKIEWCYSDVSHFTSNDREVFNTKTRTTGQIVTHAHEIPLILVLFFSISLFCFPISSCVLLKPAQNRKQTNAMEKKGKKNRVVQCVQLLFLCDQILLYSPSIPHLEIEDSENNTRDKRNRSYRTPLFAYKVIV